MGAYETWREAKWRRDNATEKGEAEWFDQVVEGLRSEALRDYLEEFAGNTFSMLDEAFVVQEESLPEFFAGLDELRTPGWNEQDKRDSELRSSVDDALAQMLRLNWTGEHTYGQAIEDAQQVLNEILHGRPFPKLERFRCPSLRSKAKGQVQCTLQLPHEGAHKSGTLSWSDEQSLNPPKNHDEEPEPGSPYCSVQADGGGSILTCDLEAGHPGPHRDSVKDRGWYNKQRGGQWADNPDPINRPEPSRCPASTRFSDVGVSMTLYCGRAVGHGGSHQALATGHAWPQQGDPEPGQCTATNAFGRRCVRPYHADHVDQLHRNEHGSTW